MTLSQLPADVTSAKKRTAANTIRDIKAGPSQVCVSPVPSSPPSRAYDYFSFANEEVTAVQMLLQNRRWEYFLFNVTGETTVKHTTMHEERGLPPLHTTYAVTP